MASTFRQQLSKIVKNLSDEEMAFATENLTLEIEHKFQSIPTPEQILSILLANIKFYRNYRDVIEEIKMRGAI